MAEWPNHHINLVEDHHQLESVSQRAIFLAEVLGVSILQSSQLFFLSLVISVTVETGRLQ